ncbi:MAG: hypothetical protein IJB84_05905 [Lachnospiraceae bacterium]|nr:hypothetical protein [Lachnospiraceae bacterium]
MSALFLSFQHWCKECSDYELCTALKNIKIIRASVEPSTHQELWNSIDVHFLMLHNEMERRFCGSAGYQGANPSAVSDERAKITTSPCSSLDGE